MTRIKKTRKGGPLAITKKDRQEGRNNLQKGKTRGKGQKAGNKQQQAQQMEQQKRAESNKDKRLGSKKPISLTPVQKTQEQSAIKPQQVWPPKTVEAQKAALEQLENDANFMAQLDILEEGGVLPAAELQAFEEKLERYDWLIETLGLAEDDDADEWDELSDQGKSLKDDWV